VEKMKQGVLSRHREPDRKMALKRQGHDGPAFKRKGLQDKWISLVSAS